MMINLKNLIFCLTIILIPSGAIAVLAPMPQGAGVELYSLGYRYEGLQMMQRNGAATPSILLRIDPTSGRVIEVGNTGFSNCQALDFSHGGKLYAKCQRPEPPHEPVLVVLDPMTGSGTEIGETGITENISDIAIDAVGDIFAYEEPGGDHNLHQVDPLTGAAGIIGSPGIEGQGNALMFWGDSGSLKLLTWQDGQNSAFMLDAETAQPTFVTNLEMVDISGEQLAEAPCVIVAAASTRSILEGEMLDLASQSDDSDTRGLLANIAGFDAIGLNQIIVNGAAASEGVQTNFIGLPEFALSLVSFEPGISILAKRIEPGYMLEGIAVRRLEPRPIPTMSGWGIAAASVILMLAALYFIFIRRTKFNNT